MIKSAIEILQFNPLFKRWYDGLCWSWITLVNIFDLISVVIAKDAYLFPSVFFWLCFHIENVKVFKNRIVNDKGGLLIEKTKPTVLFPPVSRSSETCFSMLCRRIYTSWVDHLSITWVDSSCGNSWVWDSTPHGIIFGQNWYITWFVRLSIVFFECCFNYFKYFYYCFKYFISFGRPKAKTVSGALPAKTPPRLRCGTL